MGLYENEERKKVLAFAGNDGIPFESEAEVFTFKQNNMDELCKCTKMSAINKNGEIISIWELLNIEDKNLPF